MVKTSGGGTERREAATQGYKQGSMAMGGARRDGVSKHVKVWSVSGEMERGGEEGIAVIVVKKKAE